MKNSYLVECINTGLNFLQEKTHFLEENSLIIKNIDLIIFFMIALTLFVSLFVSSSVIGYFALITFALTLLKLVIKSNQKLILTKYDFLLVLYFIFSIVSTVNSSLPLASLKGLIKTFTYMAFYFSVIQFFRYNSSKIKYIIALLGIFCIFESGVGLIQNYFDIMPLATWQDTSYLIPGQVLTRVFGTLQPSNPNLLGGYLIPTYGMLLTLTFLKLEKKQIKQFLIYGICLAISALAIVFTGCRGAYLALFVMLVCVALISHKIIFALPENDGIKKIWNYCAGGLVSIITFYILFTPAVLKRIISIFLMRGDSSTSFRMNVYGASFHMFLDNPVFGIGIGNTAFREVYGYYMRSGFDALSAYNIFLEISVEMGLIGLFIFTLYLFLLFNDTRINIFNEQNLRYRILYSGLLITLIGIVVHGFFDTVFFRPQIQLVFWVVVAMLNVILTKNRKNTADNN